MMPEEAKDLTDADKAGALIYSLMDRGVLDMLPGNTYADLGYHCRQWYGEVDPFKDVQPPKDSAS